ncbi:Lrp/AsnC family transcriptional regulator [Tenacibaculum aestuariivivum]|uniref:Lrp/AsnC family transcriptional regulator n=1 Tax=Tenacibaculum aestuariivivum TaxID=2006131 RepID=UPI003AB75DFA
MKLDLIDKRLLTLLQQDSKQTTKQLSLHLGLSVTAVYERIKKLEREGVITQYVALVNKNKIERAFLVFCHLKLEKHTKEYIMVFEREINKLEEVTECFHVSGDYDYILKIYVKDMDEYRQFLINKLTVLKHIGSTHSIFTIGVVKQSTAIAM